MSRCRLFDSPMTKALVLTAVLALSAGGVAEGATDQAPPRVAFFGFQLINTSLQSTTAEEKARIRMLDDAFRKKLDASGRFKIVPIPSDVLQEIAAAPEISNCNGCERDCFVTICSATLMITRLSSATPALPRSRRYDGLERGSESFNVQSSLQSSA